ncbi:GNAT family N-acetyltransferase [Stigmatella aurantiaca]|uniref:Acetyltransferase, GNAT family n=1 Tax=Stigmatella aurantiaca (strain DW4/3-1) TaxID=378806 RepID=Q08TA8_STIAD|nr:GNAT family N-acetyltransferase [Stigmatella aurantiaca]ADO75921.1 Acetyltransferase, GNAT family [Stigmatella aurantiaca DW4/3-1]EAU63720.1 acetyltransferase, gnat family, putative [Stigmatella aurantiaca DW4/3-1]
MSTDEVLESNVQFHKAWEFFARSCPKGEVIRSPEVLIAACNVPWSIMNIAFQPAPARTETALANALDEAARYFTLRQRAWMFAISWDWLTPEVRARTVSLCTERGLTLAMESIGMVAEHLAPPIRPLPALDLRFITDAEGPQHVADIHAAAYGAPLDTARQSISIPAMFQGESRGYLGYEKGQYVASASVLKLGDVAYVAYVATRPEFRRKGYAEALIRQALKDAKRLWGLERTGLHATLAGYPVYRRLGYREATRFGLYSPASPGR